MNELENSADESPLLLDRLHRALARWNARRLRPEHPTRRWRDEIEEDLRMRSLEGEWIEAERATLDQARWWMRQELVGDASLDALVTLTRLRIHEVPRIVPPGPAIEIRRLGRFARVLGV